MTERDLILEGWFLWSAPPIYIGEQWSYEEKQAMRRHNSKPLKINRIAGFDAVQPWHMA